MNKKLLIILSSIAILGISGCGQTKPDGFVSNTSTPPTSTTSTTSPLTGITVPTTTITTSTGTRPPTTSVSTIDKNKVGTWPRFEFKELGFSIQLPFEKENVSSRYHDCAKPEDRCDSKDMYSFDVAFKIKNEYSIDGTKIPDYWRGFLGSTSLNFSYDGVPGLLTENNLKPLNNGYTIKNIPPLKTIVVQGITIPLFDANNATFIYEVLDETKRTAAIIKLPGNKKYKAASLIFDENDLTEKQFILLLNTIRFIK